jgi:hypothetical protein
VAGVLDRSGDVARQLATVQGLRHTERSSNGPAMSDVKAIEDAVRSLPPKELAEFRRWFAEFDHAAWDAQLQEDLAGGKLDALLSEAQADFLSGPRKEP